MALDQAGAYIEETRCSLSDYQQRYQTRRARLLKRRGELVADHPDAVATTWSLAFEKVGQANPAAADLLRLCAFLAPDAISEEIITEGATHLGPTLEPIASDAVDLDEAIAALGAYSLMRRNTTEKTLAVHRLVQAVHKDQMDAQDKHQWTERTVRAVNAAFPEVEHQTWPQCDRLLPHALLCVTWMEQESMVFPEAARLLNQIGDYLEERARYGEAESLLERALAIREQIEAKSLDMAQSLNNLAHLYNNQGRYTEAEPLLQRALAIYEQQLGPQHPHTAQSLNNLASLYLDQGKYEQAEPLFQRALSICEQLLGPQHPTTQTIRANYAHLLRKMGHDAEAAALDQP